MLLKQGVIMLNLTNQQIIDSINNKMVIANKIKEDIMYTSNSADYGEQIKISGYYDEDGEWISYSRNNCCKNDLIEVGWYDEGDVDNLVVDPEESVMVDEDCYMGDAVAYKITYKFYRCNHCGEVYPETEVINANMSHDYYDYNRIESEWDIAPLGRLPNGRPRKVSEEHDHYVNVGNNVFMEEFTDDDNYDNHNEIYEDETIVADSIAYEPHTRMSKECYKIMKKVAFECRIGRGIDYINANVNVLSENDIDISRLLNIARCFKTKGWSFIRLNFKDAAAQRKAMGWTKERELSGYITTKLAPAFKKPYNHIYKSKITTPNTLKPRGYSELLRFMANTGIWTTNAAKLFKSITDKKYFIVDYYKSLPTAKEGTLISFEYINGQFVNTNKTGFMSNISPEDANTKTMKRCNDLIAKYKSLGYVVMFRDMDKICIKEHNMTANRILVRKLWGDIANYARMIKKSNYACIVK
jgi:hypothetical protein